MFGERCVACEKATVDKTQCRAVLANDTCGVNGRFQVEQALKLVIERNEFVDIVDVFFVAVDKCGTDGGVV